MVEVLKINTKCAEIFCEAYEEPKFTIVCICGLFIQDYNAFQQHFANEHLQFTQKHMLELTALTSVDAQCLEEPLCVVPNDLEESSTICQTDALNADTLNKVNQNEFKQRNKSNTCSYCGRMFRRRYLLDTHLNIHTGLKPHQCDMCGKQFRAVSTLRRHMRTHAQRETLQCKHCEKHFTHRSALLSHELRHTQVRQFACSSCDKCFYTLNQRDTHCRKLHSEQKFETDRISTQPLPFACELCANSYRSASTLSTHKLKKHYSRAKYCCEQCNKKFVDPDRLKQHLQIHVKPNLSKV